MISLPVTAVISVELLVELTGVYLPARSAPFVRNSPPEEPDEPASVEDIAIEDVIYETCIRVKDTTSTVGFRRRRVPHSLLVGVDTSNHHVQRLLANLLELVTEEAAEALTADVSE